MEARWRRLIKVFRRRGEEGDSYMEGIRSVLFEVGFLFSILYFVAILIDHFV